MKRIPNLERVLVASSERSPQDGAAYRVAADSAEEFTIDEATAILGLAWGMAIVGGGAVTSDEEELYAALVLWLAQRVNRELVLEASEAVKTMSGSIEDLARLHSAKLRRRSVRELAYKASYLMRLWDLESNPKEEALDELHVGELDLRDVAEALTGEVNALLYENE